MENNNATKNINDIFTILKKNIDTYIPDLKAWLLGIKITVIHRIIME